MKEGCPKAGDVRKFQICCAAKKTPEKQKTGSRKMKDPNNLKPPQSTFFIFLEQFWKEFQEKHPDNKLVSEVGKAGANKWKWMSDAEKAPYVAKSEKMKDEYIKKMRSYDGSNAVDDESSHKSKSEVSKGAGSDEEEEDD